MGMHHIATCIPDRYSTVKGIRARIYRANSTSPNSITAHFRVNTRQPSKDRFVFAADLLGNPRRQTYIHDITLSIRYRRTLYKFLVFFKKHKMLPQNQSIQNLGGSPINGDVLLIACGKRVSVRNLRSGLEDRVADKAIERLSDALSPIRSQRYFPPAISFDL
ncbi:hypothetical protein DFJ43DRAFT_1150635 [Lentinula guzmanii]|uniref:Uncharacterized protein n=1 Tax=Lentinula guzmanii TaxID=2804957 RepID=A0AA38MWJ8_9AGAR|nr:hypothetical protein DFJ43DRAFT_1150635 [Lentinula guzmanii]